MKLYIEISPIYWQKSLKHCFISLSSIREAKPLWYQISNFLPLGIRPHTIVGVDGEVCARLSLVSAHSGSQEAKLDVKWGG